MALNLATLSDAFNDIPYTEALMGSIDAGLEPSYDLSRINFPSCSDFT